MKRTILAAIMLAMTVVCAGFSAAAAEQIVLDASAEYTSGGLEITATANNGTDEAKDCTMYFCVFEDDVLRAVRMSEQTVPAGTSSVTETISMAQPSEGQSFDIKVFMWDEKMQSETEPAQISYSYLKTNNAISFEAGLFDGFDDRDNILSVYKTIERYDICEYSMSDDWKLIVNGIVTDNEYIYDCFYSDCAPTRKAELADNDGDGEYDELSVDYYVTTAFHSASETGTDEYCKNYARYVK